MGNIFGDSWKTTVSSIFTAFMGFVAFQPDLFPALLVSIAKYLALAGVVSVGMVAKDFNKTGTGGNTSV